MDVLPADILVSMRFFDFAPKDSDQKTNKNTYKTATMTATTCDNNAGGNAGTVFNECRHMFPTGLIPTLGKIHRSFEKLPIMTDNFT